MADSRRKKGSGSVQKKANGKWYGKVQIGTDQETGKKIYQYFSGNNKTAVLEKMKVYSSRLDAHKEDLANKINHQKVILKPCMNEWLLVVKKNKLKSESYRRLVGTCENHILKKLGNQDLTKLTTDIVQRKLINAMFEEGQSLSSIKKAKSAMTDFFDYWRRKEMAQNGKNIPDIMDLIEMPGAHLFDKKEIKVMTDEETQRFLKVLYRKDGMDQNVYEYADLINLILQTGMRIGEACALEITDCDPEARTITISKDVIETNELEIIDGENKFGKRKIVTQNTAKTKNGMRTIPINQSAYESFQRLKHRTIELNENNKKIALTSSSEPIWPSNLVRTINNIYIRAKIDLSGAHALRHTYATALFNQGIELKTVSELLGHSGIQITADTYVHIIQSMKYKDNAKNKFKPYPEHLLKNTVPRHSKNNNCA